MAVPIKHRLSFFHFIVAPPQYASHANAAPSYVYNGPKSFFPVIILMIKRAKAII